MAPPVLQRAPRIGHLDLTTRQGCGGRNGLVLMAALYFALSLHCGAYNIRSITTQDHSGISIEICNPLSEEPRSGFLPLHLRIVNKTSKPHEWTLEAGVMGGSRLGYSVKIGAAAGEAREIDLHIPQASLAEGRTGAARLSGKVTGYGIERSDAAFFFGGSYSGAVDTAYVAMSHTLADKSWSAIGAEIKASAGTKSREELAQLRFASIGTSARGLLGSSVLLSEMPADARAFSGFAALWLSSADWNGLSSELRRAVREWVIDGGRLFVASERESEPMEGLLKKLKTGAPVAIGFGQVKLVSANDNVLPPKETADDILDLDSAPQPAASEDYTSKWSLLEKFEQPRLNAALIIAFVSLFAVVIGPCNLIWFAPRRSRHRLFFTVPAISLGSIAILFCAIAAGDGIGANGGRNVLACLPAGENRCSIQQEQASRSHLLVKRSFTAPEEASIAELPARNRTDSARTFERSGTELKGDWFHSRAFQAQTLRMALPTRAEVVLQSSSGTAPVLLSSAATALRDVFYCDAAGQLWHADEITPGRAASLAPSTDEAYNAWVSGVSARLSANMRATLSRVAHRPGCFYAQADATAEIPIETLRSVKWPSETIVYFGPCAPEEH